jgi:hypothetical protein
MGLRRAETGQITYPHEERKPSTNCLNTHANSRHPARNPDKIRKKASNRHATNMANK